MKKSIYALLAMSLLAASCNTMAQKSSNTPTPSSEMPGSSASIPESSTTTPTPSSSNGESEDHTMTFSAVVDLLSKGIAVKEGKASSESLTTTTGRDGHNTITSLQASLFNDNTSRVDGTVTSETANYTYQKRAGVVKDKINYGGSISELELFATATDYGDPNKKDEATKQYIFNTDAEAKANSVSDGYILKGQENFYSSLQLTQKLYLYAGTLATSAYVSQTGVKGFDYAYDENEDCIFSTNVSYSYTEEGIIEEITYTASFKMDKGWDKLKSIDLTMVQKETRENDPTDTSTYTDKSQGSIVYGTKGAVSEGSINVNDYFMSDVTEIDILNDQRQVVENSTIYEGTSHYIFALPKTYTPATAADVSEWSLTPVASTNEDIVECVSDNSGSFFEIQDVGTVTLTWEYLGKNSNNIWEFKTITKEVTIDYAPITEIAFTNQFSPAVTNNALTAGNIYTQRITINPSYGKGTIVASSSDTDTLVVSIDQSGSYVSLKLVPLKSGTAVVTVKVEGNDDTAISETFRIAAIPAADIPNILTAASWSINDLYLDTITLTFAANNTGTWIWDYTDNSNNPVHEQGDFAWTIKNGRVKITSFFNSNDEEYEYLNNHFAESAGLLAMTPDGGYSLTFGSDTYMKDYIFYRNETLN
ncbi:MAG: hypothetical protein K6B51_04685 [Bacilli bacterium]|nr:hypothetical protein [Bacilli bacterium]